MSYHRIPVLALAGILTLSLTGCVQEETSDYVAPSGVAVQTQIVERSTVSNTNKVSGKVIADNETSVYVPTNALCTAVYVEQGDEVKAGDIICHLDLNSTLASQVAANVSYNSAVQSYNDQEALFNAQIALAENNLLTTQRLFEIGAASKLEVDNASLQLQQLQATKNSTLAQLEAGIQSGLSNLSQLGTLLEHVDGRGNVIAPASGLITTLTCVESSYISAAYPVAVITGADQMKLSVMVSETLVPQLKIGDEVDVSVSSANTAFTGTIRSIDTAANPQTKLYGVTVSIPAEVTGLLVGMSADITFFTNVSDDAVVIPSQAILTSNGVDFVFVVSNGTAQRHEVETGLTGSGVTEILSGLEGSEELVTVGQNYLSDGCAVRVVSGED